MPPPCDAALEAAVKAEEKKTGEEAPYFGAETQREALELPAWKRIGKAWKNRAPDTCWQAYVSRYPVDGAPPRYEETVKAEVLRGDHDALLKKAAGRCFQSDLHVYKCTSQFVTIVDCRTVQTRLVALGYKEKAETWAAALDVEVAALKERYEGRSFFYDEDGSEHVVDDVGFYGKHPEPVAICVCVAVGNSDEFHRGDEWTAGFDDVETWSVGGVVEEAPPPPALPPVPEPPKPPKAPTTRGGRKRAAARTAMSEGARQTNEKRQKKAAVGAAADKAEAKDDVEPDDGAFRDYVPPHEQIEGDARPTTVNDDALRATIGDASLLDDATVQTPLQRKLAPMQMKRPPKDAPVVLPGEVLPRIGEVGWTIEGDRDLTKLTRAVEIITGEIEDACGGSGRRGDPKNHAADVYLDGKHVKVKNNRNGAGCLHVVGPNDGTSSDKSRAFLSYVKRLAAKAHGEDKAALEFFAAQCERWLFTRTLLVELATYPAGRAGDSHRDLEEPDLKTQHDYRHRGGEAKGFHFAGPVKLRLALSVVGKRSMSFRDARGWVATIDRSPGRGVCFVDGAHTRSRGVVEHRNDAGDAPGATLILTFRADASSAFDHMTPAARLFAHAGIALFAAH